MTTDHAAGAAHASILEWILVVAAAIVLVWALGLAIRYWGNQAPPVKPEDVIARRQ